MAFGGSRSSCVRPSVHSARRLRSLAFLCSSDAGLDQGTPMLPVGEKVMNRWAAFDGHDD